MSTRSTPLFAHFVDRHPVLWFAVLYCVCFTAMVSALTLLPLLDDERLNLHLLSLALTIPFWLANHTWARRSAIRGEQADRAGDVVGR